MPRDKSSSNSKSSLRRSLRPRKPDKASFRCGDVVEVSYKNGIEMGTLLCQVSDDRWIVKYKNNNIQEQQVSEKSFGDIIHRSESKKETKQLQSMESKDDATSSSSRKTRRKLTPHESNGTTKFNFNRSNSSSLTGTLSSDGDCNQIASTRTSLSSTTKGIKFKEPVLSAREKRMRMREEANSIDTDNLVQKKKKRKTKMRDSSHRKNESRKEVIVSKVNSKKEKEEVVKVKLNTGTLYLYRGMNPRAVFMRRY